MAASGLGLSWRLGECHLNARHVVAALEDHSPWILRQLRPATTGIDAVTRGE